MIVKISRIEVSFCFFFAFSAHATSVTLPYAFTAGSPISASQMMGNFASITSAISSTVSSPWVTSSSNIYYNAGSVGIGSSAPTHALDVGGSMAVNGYIKSNNIWFMAYNSVYTTSSTDGWKVHYNTLISGSSSSYSASTYSFVVPVAGVYFFSASVMGTSGNAPAQYFIYNSTSGVALWNTVVAYNMHATLSGLMFCNVNDVVYVVSAGSVPVWVNSGDYFSGYLLNASL